MAILKLTLIESWDISTGVTRLRADKRCKRSLACCSTAITKASWTALPSSPAAKYFMRQKRRTKKIGYTRYQYHTQNSRKIQLKIVTHHLWYKSIDSGLTILNLIEIFGMFTAIYTKLYFINQLSLEAENLPSPCKGVPTKTIYLNKVWYIVYRKFSNVVFEQSFSFINREKKWIVYRSNVYVTLILFEVYLFSLNEMKCDICFNKLYV